MAKKESYIRAEIKKAISNVYGLCESPNLPVKEWDTRMVLGAFLEFLTHKDRGREKKDDGQ